MGYDSKYGRVTTEHGDIPDDEPVFVFRARDLLAPDAIDAYAARCRETARPEFHVALAERTAEDFREWQRANPGRVRMPDSEAHRERLEARDEHGREGS